jgi:hypothetical protein
MKSEHKILPLPLTGYPTLFQFQEFCVLLFLSFFLSFFFSFFISNSTSLICPHNTLNLLYPFNMEQSEGTFCQSKGFLASWLATGLPVRVRSANKQFRVHWLPHCAVFCFIFLSHPPICYPTFYLLVILALTRFPASREQKFLHFFMAGAVMHSLTGKNRYRGKVYSKRRGKVHSILPSCLVV